nr:MAG TPA: hypothetical protein [Caudoviricetes sp.]
MTIYISNTIAKSLLICYYVSVQNKQSKRIAS